MKTTLRTGESGPPQAASTFIVPMTLFSWASRGRGHDRVDDQARVDDGVDLGRLDDAADERVRVGDAHELRAAQLDLRRPAVDADDRLDLRARLERLRQPAAPVGRQPGDEDPPRGHPNHTDRRRPTMSNSSSWIVARMSSATVCTRALSSQGASPMPSVRTGGQEADQELRGQVAEHPQQPEVRERGRDREVQEAGEPLQRRDVGEDRRGLLGADDGDGHDRRPRAHRRLDEAAAAEAPQPVAVLVELLGALAALGEDEHELLLVEQQPVDVGRDGRPRAPIFGSSMLKPG